MAFQIAEMKDCIYSVLAYAKGVEGATASFSIGHENEIRESFTQSVSKTIANTISYEKGHTDGYDFTLSRSSTIGAEGAIGPKVAEVRISASTTVGQQHNWSSSDTESVTNATTTSSEESKSFGTDYAQKVVSGTSMTVPTKAGHYYAFVEVCRAYVFEVVTFGTDQNTGETVITDIGITLSYGPKIPTIYDAESDDSFDFKFATAPQNALLTDAQLQSALELYKSGTTVTPVGEYALTLVDDSGTRTIKYTSFNKTDAQNALKQPPKARETYTAEWETDVLQNKDQTIKAIYSDEENYVGYTRISTVAELKTIGSTGKYVLIKDISNVGNWAPIKNFSGILDGHNHTISGISFKKAASEWNDHIVRCGFIEDTRDGAVIKNLTISGAEFAPTNEHGKDIRAGILVGNSYGNTKIESCKVLSSSLTYYPRSTDGTTILGGIVGFSENTTSINDCVVSGVVVKGASFKVYVGGITGEALHQVSVVKCTVSGSILHAEGHSPFGIDFTGNTDGQGWVGGIVGLKANTVDIRESSVSDWKDQVNSNYNGFQYEADIKAKHGEGEVYGKLA